MHLKALDQFHISSVSAETLAPGRIFSVSDALGAELMKKHPGKFEMAEGQKAEDRPLNKSEPKPGNKGEDPKGYHAHTVKDLKEIAEKRGVDLGDATRKDDIIAALELSDEQGGQSNPAE